MNQAQSDRRASEPATSSRTLPVRYPPNPMTTRIPCIKTALLTLFSSPFSACISGSCFTFVIKYFVNFYTTGFTDIKNITKPSPMREFMLVIHFIGLSMALGTGFANIFLGRAAAKLEPAERGSFLFKTLILMHMGRTGLVLLISSGLYMITPYWQMLTDMPLLMAKLGCVVLLVTIVFLIQRKTTRAVKENNPALLASVKPWGMLNFVVAITIVVLSVLIFR